MPYTEEIEDLHRPQKVFNFTFGGLEFGDGTPYEITSIEGLDMPGLRTSDSDKALDHGEILGAADWLQGRTITVGLQVIERDLDVLWPILNALDAATVPGQADGPLVVSLPGIGAWSTVVRVRKRAMQITQATLRGVQDINLEFKAGDPLLYSSMLTKAALETYHNAHLIHVGNAPMRPNYEIRGAVKNPAINRFGDDGYKVEEFSLALEMVETDVLTIDRDGVVMLNGQRAFQYVIPGSVLPKVYPGETNIGYIGEDNGQSRCTVYFRSARV